MTNTVRVCGALTLLVSLVAVAGCQSPYHADRGALFGGLTGAGVGAIAGDAVGKAGAGTAIGAGIGAITGAAIGQGMDEVEARNRAMIEQQLGAKVFASAVSMGDVVTMSKAGVDDELIVNHIRAHGADTSLAADDLIFLSQQGVSTRVIKAMQTPSVQTVMVQQPVPRPVVVEKHYYRTGPIWGPHCRHHRRPGVSWGVSVGH